MSIFQNSFFSIAGQKERLANVANTLYAAVVPQAVQKAIGYEVGPVVSNTGIKAIDKPLEVAANHPFATAAVATVVAKPKVAVAAVKEVVTKVKSVVSTAATKAKAVTSSAAKQPIVQTLVAAKVAQPKVNVVTPTAPPPCNNTNDLHGRISWRWKRSPTASNYLRRPRICDSTSRDRPTNHGRFFRCHFHKQFGII